MNKKDSTFVNMSLALLLITFVAGLSLGYVNELTVGPIAKAKREQKIKAIKRVLPEFTNNPVAEEIKIPFVGTRDSIEVYPGKMNDEEIGVAIIGFSEKGYSGLIKLMVGFTNEGKINNIVVLEQKETPGLGTKMKENYFLDQFKDKDPKGFKLIPKKDGGDIDVLTGATISTRAFGEAAQMAYEVFTQVK